jgi:hypothetical protein
MSIIRGIPRGMYGAHLRESRNSTISILINLDLYSDYSTRFAVN